MKIYSHHVYYEICYISAYGIPNNDSIRWQQCDFDGYMLETIVVEQTL